MLNAPTPQDELSALPNSALSHPAIPPFGHPLSSKSSAQNQLVFVDAGLANLETLTQGLQAEQVVFVSQHENGIQKVAEVLSTQQDLMSVHIFGHASSGELSLGNSKLDASAINRYSSELETWGTALLGEGDLFLYGCDLASGATGIHFVETLAQATQADVAASDDTTGHADLGGDWELEVVTGVVTEAIALESYQGILPTYQGKDYQLTTASSWEAAQAEAESLGGTLVAINNAAEERWIEETFGKAESFWIGLSDRLSEGTFVWENGDTTAYRNWAPGEPNDYRIGADFIDGEDYTLKNWNGTGLWNDVPNTLQGSTYRGIVEIETTQPQPPNPQPPNPQPPNNNTLLEAENATLSGGASTNTNHAGFSGSGFVDGFVQKGAAATFTVSVAESGTYNTTLRYSNGPFGASNNGTKDLSLYVNGIEIKDTQLSSTGTWKAWDTQTEALSLQAGSNTISYRHDADNNGIVNLDTLTLAKASSSPNPPTPPTPDNSQNTTAKRIEAESAQLTGPAGSNTNHTGFSGKGFVDKFNPGAAATFTVQVDSAGTYNTTLRYANGPFGASNNGTKNLSLYVNGIDIKNTNLVSTGGWDTWNNKTEALTLKAGTNTITYQANPGDNSIVNLDYIWTAKSVGNGALDLPINDFGVGLEVKKIAQLPTDSTGAAARMIGMATQGRRTFVYEERDGHIYDISSDISGNSNSSRNPTLFFDVGAAVQASTGRKLNTQNVTHGGLKGVAFHPDFTTNGKFYTSIMENRPSNAAQFNYLSDAANPINADAVVVEWSYDFGSSTVINNSYREVLRIGMPVYDHPIKEMIFNNYAKPGDEDYGLLYIAHGDGSVQSATAGGGLNKDALGKILRVNPLQNGSARYTVPNSNPFVNSANMLDEVYSIGHRNPHTLSFALDNNGKSQLIVGEAGRDNIEEINIIKPGGNYGWSEREGTFVHLPEGGGIVQGLAPLPEDDAKNSYIYPAAQYGHNGTIGKGFVGQAVAGGYVGAKGSQLSGQYIFGDFATSGQLYHSKFTDLLNAVTQLDSNNPNRDAPSDLTQAPIGAVDIFFDHDNNSSTAALKRTNMKDVLNDEASYDGSGRADIRFGRGASGEMYLLNKRNGYVYLITSSVA
ncbi:MAG: DUF4347 domain-containing protein [Cyanobacteria bacterium J06598_1]